MNLAWALQRYWVSVTFPTISAWCIYADWSHTQEWKKQLKQKMGYIKFISSGFTFKNVFFCIAPLGGAYVGKIFDDGETERMSRFRDRSALYGRPPPPSGVKEIPSW